MSVASPSQPYLPKLPPHEPPQFPLRADAALAANRLRKHEAIRYLRQGLDKSADLLNECVDDINNLVAEREAAAAKDDDGEGEEGEEGARALAERVDDVTAKMERAVRRGVDAQHELVGCEETLADAAERVGRGADGAAAAASQAVASTQRSSRRGGRAAAGGEDDEMGSDEEEQEEDEDTPMTGVTATQTQRSNEFAPSVFWTEQLAAKKDKYEAQSLRIRYSEHKSYVSFRNAAWVARHPDGETMPHASTWFRAQEGGSPAPGTAMMATNEDEDEESDDLQTIRVKISTKCPLSLVEMREPISNRKCAHAFEKDTIERYIRQNKRARGPGQEAGAACPVAGCDKVLVLEDLYMNYALVRNVRRLQEARLRADGEMEGVEVEEEGGFEDIDSD
jgi:hypothetical protein